MARPRLRAENERVRLNLEINKTLYRQMQTLQRRSGVSSLTDLVRKSMAFFDLVQEHINAGGKIVFRHADGTEEILKLL